METTNDIDITEEDMMRFVQSNVVPRRKPGELTCEILATATGKTRRWSLDMLTRLERQGLVRSKWIIENQRKVKAFVPTKGTWSDLLD